MRCREKVSSKTSESGVALLFAIFALMIISAIGIGLILSSSVETSLASNYRTSAQAYYAALSGLEEGRGRLWVKSPTVFPPAFIPPQGSPLPLLLVGQVRYILNPAPGEVVDPVNLASAYPDTEYQQEFGAPPTAANTQTINSASPQAGLPGPMYKWVRINAVTEASLGYDIDGDGTLDNASPLYYNFNPTYNQPTLTTNLTPGATQALEVTAFAIMPNGSRRILQYLLGARTFNLSFPSAMTLNGTGDTYSGANSNVFWMNGNDQTNGGTCGLTAPPVPAIGVPNNADVTNVINGIPGNRTTHYLGTGTPPAVANISSSMPPSLQTVGALDGPNGLVQLIMNNADYVVQGPASTLPDFGSSSSPVITVVNGDLSLSGNVTGYGILVVTGNYTASGNVGWRGIVLVIGKGTMQVNGGGNNSYDGAVLLANTRDASGNLLPNLGPVSLNWNGGGGNGVYYNTCLINSAQNTLTYRVLSFREIPQ